jgi:hypothetical protein
MAAASEPAADSTEKYAASRPVRRNGPTIARKRNAAAGISSAIRANESASLLIL